MNHTLDTAIEEVARKDSGETVAERLARLGCNLAAEGREERLERAHLFVNDQTFKLLAEAPRVSEDPTIVLPHHRFELLSRGKGWARQGRGDKAVWGEREDAGYRVGPGYWTVGGHDGFTRKGEISWRVKNVKVGAATWTVAE